MPSSLSEPAKSGPVHAAAELSSTNPTLTQVTSVTSVQAASTPTQARSLLLSPRQRALLEASNEPDLDTFSLSLLSHKIRSDSCSVHLDLATILASEKVYKDVVATAYPCSVGKALSQEDRDESIRATEGSLTYGEIPFRSMAFILEKIRQDYGRPRAAAGKREGADQGEEEEEMEEEEMEEDENKERRDEIIHSVMQEPGKDVLYDIGSGTGKPCFAAAALFPFRKVVGIELLDKLHEAAMKIRKKWEMEAVSALVEARKGGEGGEASIMTTTQLEFLHGDFRDVSLCDWPSEADICVANSTCFSPLLMRDLAELAAGMKEGSVFVTLTRRLPSEEHWEVVDDTLMVMSWGGATVYTQRKKTPPAFVNRFAGVKATELSRGRRRTTQKSE
ncbi:hypothetical protein VYU27_006778 [Nannochloropsis oceanica]